MENLNNPPKNKRSPFHLISFGRPGINFTAISALLLCNTAFAADNVRLMPGQTVFKTPVAFSEMKATLTNINNVIVTGAISDHESDITKRDCNNWSAKFGWSSDHKYWGLKVAEDVIVSFNGETWGGTESTRNGRRYSSSGGFTANPGTEGVTFTQHVVKSSNPRIYCAYLENIEGINWKGGHYSILHPSGGGLNIYAGPKAVAQTIPVNIYYGVSVAPSGLLKTLWSGTITVRARECTISTDNLITFPPVDVSSGVNGRALANKSGNISIRCDDATNAPVSIEMQGDQGRFSDTLALKMSDGGTAPAEVRGFIGSNIPLGGECNGRLDRLKGVVYFTANAGMEKISLTPGTYQYNWVLCSTGGLKTGKATGVVRMVANWD